jgi:hypothetical protein
MTLSINYTLHNNAMSYSECRILVMLNVAMLSVVAPFIVQATVTTVKNYDRNNVY